ncbi:MAG: squalene/phytoene synthase family protein [Myxococcales bacterium]|nr:squalene/phytoene synthase family protein [Myxococcota bacterium]MDW8280351.1 squalene/phytoene synthase family protein [Myxococcales bacterium]
MSDTLDDLLRRVSRSFYLSIHVLPTPVRGPIAVGYLLARAADTIADTEVVPAAERLELLAALRQAALGEADAKALQLRVRSALLPGVTGLHDEQRLLGRLADCLRELHRLDAEDRERVQRVLGTLITGMERDLLRFPAASGGVPPEHVRALSSLAELDEYTYYAAGCVGEFWSELCGARLPGLSLLRRPDLVRRGVSLGRALQMVNVIRDAPADLRAGRCYWPAEVLAMEGLTPVVLAGLAWPGAPLPPAQAEAVVAATARLIRLTLSLVEEAWPYVQAIPPQAVRLRLSCTWPLLLGLDTLRLIQQSGSPLLVPGRVLKVSRGRVRQLLLRSSVAAGLDWARRQAVGGQLDRLRQSWAQLSGV